MLAWQKKRAVRDEATKLMVDGEFCVHNLSAQELSASIVNGRATGTAFRSALDTTTTLSIMLSGSSSESSDSTSSDESDESPPPLSPMRTRNGRIVSARGRSRGDSHNAYTRVLSNQ